MSEQARPGWTDDNYAFGRRAARDFLEAIGRVETFDVDEPNNPEGEWWFDFVINGKQVNVAWRRTHGYGVYTSDEDKFGAHPDEIYKDPMLAARRVLQIVDRQNGAFENVNMRLGDVRRLLGKQQTYVAERLYKGQSVISRLERQNDAMLSTVRSYVEALGGTVKLSVKFDGFEAPIDLPDAMDESYTALKP